MKFIKRSITAFILAITLAAPIAAQSTSLSFNKSALAKLSSNHTSYYYYDELEKEYDEFSDLISDIFALIWTYDNIFVNFDTYPYAHGRYIKFINPFLPEYTNVIIDFDSEEYGDPWTITFEGHEVFVGKPYRFEIDANATFYPMTKIFAQETRFEGYIWKFFGPVFEHVLYEELGTPMAAMAGNLKLGGQFSLIHSNFFDWSLYMQWTHWYGFFKGDGIAVGSIMRAYPVKPLLVEWRVSAQDLDLTRDSGTNILESNLEAGIMAAGPVEVYAAWKFIIDQCFTGSIDEGITCGVKLHF